MSKNRQIRAFFAIDISPEIRTFLTDLQQAFRPELNDFRIRWVNPSNIHLTVQFLGDIDESTVRALATSVRLQTHPFELRLDEFGFFPSAKRPRVLWVGFADSPTLLQLVDELKLQTQLAGIADERENFKAHLTLGRFRESAHLQEPTLNHLKTTYDKLRQKLTHAVSTVALYESTLNPRGSIYTPLHVFPLGSKAPESTITG